MKKTMAILMAVVLLLGVFSGNRLPVFAATVPFDVTDVQSNASVAIRFSDPVTSLTTSNFYLSYKVGDNDVYYKRNITRIESLNSDNKQYRLFFEPIEATDTKQLVKANLSYDSGAARLFEFEVSANTANYFKVTNSKNGSFTVEFDSAKPDLTVDDLSARLYIDSVDKGSLSLKSLIYVSSYKFDVVYDKLSTSSSNTQNVRIDVRYKNGSIKTSTFTLYASGSTSDGNIGSEYDDLNPAMFSILDVKNGEIDIRFLKSIRYTLTASDLLAKYYIDGTYKGELKITDVDEDDIREGTDYKVYFDLLPTTATSQSVTVLLFSKRDSGTKPAKEVFTISKEDEVYETDVKIAEVKEFTESIVLPKITVKELGRNTIFASSRSNTEYIKLEAPEGFEWSLEADVYGVDALKGATNYDVKYDTSNGTTVKNILLVGLISVSSDRSKVGSLEMSALKLTATSKADYGDVKVRISGAGIPYERFTVAKYIQKTTPTPTPSPSPSPTPSGLVPKKDSFVLTVIEGVPQITVNGEVVLMDTKPFIQDDRMMLPVSFIAVAFGIPASEIKWDDVTKSVTIRDGANVIELKIGSQIMTVNGQYVVMDTSAMIKDSRTFIPMSFLGKALGFEPTWNAATRSAVLKR